MKYEQLQIRQTNARGFTLIELLIVIALISILGFLATGFYARFYNQNATSIVTDEMTQELRKAQIYAMTGKQNSNWGVHNGTNQFTLFSGNTYMTRNSAFDESFSENSVTITGFADLIFSRVTGTPSATQTIIISGNSTAKTITVNAQGVVSR